MFVYLCVHVLCMILFDVFDACNKGASVCVCAWEKRMANDEYSFMCLQKVEYSNLNDDINQLLPSY